MITLLVSLYPSYCSAKSPLAQVLCLLSLTSDIQLLFHLSSKKVMSLFLGNHRARMVFAHNSSMPYFFVLTDYLYFFSLLLLPFGFIFVVFKSFGPLRLFFVYILWTVPKPSLTVLCLPFSLFSSLQCDFILMVFNSISSLHAIFIVYFPLIVILFLFYFNNIFFSSYQVRMKNITYSSVFVPKIITDRYLFVVIGLFS